MVPLTLGLLVGYNCNGSSTTFERCINFGYAGGVGGGGGGGGGFPCTPVYIPHAKSIAQDTVSLNWLCG